MYHVYWMLDVIWILLHLVSLLKFITCQLLGQVFEISPRLLELTCSRSDQYILAANGYVIEIIPIK